MSRIDLISVLFSFSLLGVIVELVRRNRILVRYSLLWIATASIMLMLSLNRSLLEQVAATVGIFYAPSALFLTLSFFMLGILIGFSITISDLRKQKILLTQELSRLELRVRTMEISAQEIKKDLAA